MTTTKTELALDAVQLAKALIAETLQSYALACDEMDRAAFLEIFTPDARAKYDADPWLSGAENIADWIGFATQGVFYSQHTITPVRITPDGDKATAVGYLTSYQRNSASPDDLVTMNSRYDWKLRNQDGTWRIAELMLKVGWLEIRHVEQPAGGIRTIEEND